MTTPTIHIPHNTPYRVEDKTWDGCDDPNGCIIAGAGGDVVIRDVSMFGVPRAVLVYPNATNGDFDGAVIDGLVVRGCEPHESAPDRNEAICLHGNGPVQYPDWGFQGWVRNVETRNVHVLDWPQEPMSIWNTNSDRVLLTEWVSESPSPVRISLKKQTRHLDVRIKGGSWATPVIEWVLVGPHVYSSDQIGNVETPPGWKHSLKWWWGSKREDWGTYESVEELRDAMVERASKWRATQYDYEHNT